MTQFVVCLNLLASLIQEINQASMFQKLYSSRVIWIILGKFIHIMNVNKRESLQLREQFLTGSSLTTIMVAITITVWYDTYLCTYHSITYFLYEHCYLAFSHMLYYNPMVGYTTAGKFQARRVTLKTLHCSESKPCSWKGTGRRFSIYIWTCYNFNIFNRPWNC